MITDEKAQELVARANTIVATGFGRNGMVFPEHIAVASPIVAAVFVMLVEEERANTAKRIPASLMTTLSASEYQQSE